MRPVVRAVAAWVVLGLVIALAPAWPASADATDGTRLTGYAVQPAGEELSEIVGGPDGDLWSYIAAPGSPFLIDQMTPDGVVSAVYTASGAIDDIVAGTDGDVWYAATTGQYGPALVRITPSGVQTPFALPSGDGVPTALTVGPDGNMWFAATGGFIGEFSATGVLTQYSIPTQGYESVVHLAMGSDGALWFTQDLSTTPNFGGWVGISTVGRITASGAVTLHPLATGTGDARGLVLGPDGDVWFTENSDSQGTSALVAVAPTGLMTTYVLPTGTHGYDLTAGPDGNLWVVENFDITIGEVNHGQVAVVDPAGEQVAAYTEPGLSELLGITTGSDGNIWYGDSARLQAIRIDLHHGAAAAVTLSTTAGPSSAAGHVSVLAQVTGSATSLQGPVTPTGTVVFSVDGLPRPAVPLVDGEAMLDITGLPTPLDLTVTAQYFGDDYFLGAASAPLQVALPGTLTTAQGTSVVTTPAFDVTGPQLLVALVSGDGPKQKQSATVTGAGLTWTLAERANKEGGTAEIWTADVTGSLTAATVSSSLAKPGYDELLTVLAVPDAGGLGAGATAGEEGGAPTVQLTTTNQGSYVVAVGEDYTQAVAPVIPADQLLLSQWVDTAPGETFWTQQNPRPRTGGLAAGTKVTVDTTAPTADTWDLAAVEVVMGAGAA